MKAFAAALLLAAPIAAAARDMPLVVTPAERVAIAQAVARGRLMFAYDRAAWIGTDDMLAKVPDPAGKLAGYVADGPIEAPRLTFYDRQSPPRAAYVAHFRDGRLVDGKLLGPTDDRTLSPALLRSIAALTAARTVAAKAGLRPCAAQSFNSIVLPPETADGPTRVYLMTPQTDTLPLGGHWEIDVAADGTAGPPHAFTRGCLPLGRPEAGHASVAAVAVQHLLDPIPTEIHVFSSLAAGRAILVATMTPRPRVWTVTGTGIGDPVALPAIRR